MNNLGSMYQHGEGLPQDLHAALDCYERAAAAGCGVAMGNLGHFHTKGRAGLPADARRGFALYRRGALAGDHHAMLSLGTSYLDGRGTSRQPLRALWWYRRAAYHGAPGGLFNLGLEYRHGTIVRRDLARAEALYQEATLYRHAASAFELGSMRELGENGPVDLREALNHYTLAHRFGDADAMESVMRVLAQFRDEPGSGDEDGP